eukprot:gene34975-13335_t
MIAATAAPARRRRAAAARVCTLQRCGGACARANIRGLTYERLTKVERAARQTARRGAWTDA